MARLGTFEESARPILWFDSEAVADGWFDKDLVGSDASGVDIAASVAAATTVSATLTCVRSVSSSRAAVSTTTSALANTRAIASAPVSVSAVSSRLSVLWAAVSAVAAQSDRVGQLTAVRAILAAIAPQALTTSVIAVIRGVTATAVAVASGAGAGAPIRALTGHAPSTAGATADLTGPVGIASVVACASVAVCTCSVLQSVASTCAGIAAADANVSASKYVASTPSISSGAAATLTLEAGNTDVVYISSRHGPSRGGTVVAVHVDDQAVADTSRDDAMTASTIASQWTTAGAVAPSTRGLQLAGDASLSLDEALAHFHVFLDVHLIAPTATNSDEMVFEATATAGSAILRIHARRDGTQLRFCSDAPLVVGGCLYVADSHARFELVRNGRHVWAFVTSRNVRTQLLGAATFPLDAAEIAFATFGAKARARLTNFKIESAVRIGSKLLEDKKIVRSHIVGTVPPSAEGTTDVVAFGTFGESVGANAFTYSPVTNHSIRVGNVALSIQNDPQIRSGA